MITVKYLTFHELEAKLEEAGVKFNFAYALKNKYKLLVDASHNTIDNPIYQAGEIIDDIYVSGEHGYLVNHNFNDSLNANYSDDEITSAACQDLKAEIENWLIGRAAYYANKVEAVYNLRYDKSLVSTNNDNWDYNKTTNEGTSGNTQKYLDTPETEADYTGDTHITNLTKNDGTSSNTIISDGKNGVNGKVESSGGVAAAWSDRIEPFVWALVQDFKKRWVTDAACLGEGF